MHRGKGMTFVGDSRIPKRGKFIPPKDYSEYPGKTEAFLPNFLLKEWMVGAVFLIGFLVLTVSEASPLEAEADPTKAGYIPLPDWYFLFLYQLLKYPYAAGDYKVIGIVILPGLAMIALLIAPWLDRGPERRAARRPIATGLMLLSLISIIYLTWESSVSHDWAKSEEQGKIVKKVDIDKSSEGYKIYSSQSCVNCHGENLEGKVGPALVGKNIPAQLVEKVAVNGIPPKMPPNAFKGSDKDLKTLAKFIEKVSKK
ncbi:menaquinol-cytochrome c reductase cytochrome b/c subunit [Scopulibacillus darangshiensis]|uniref:Menaquinol-cytochrome c reductase cytochrome b/c subunit n=1 Tax=Scopulibacillus darangshiensis TaxID=442528 RepID=A0A4V2SNL3_9BACL|nr:menaquinol-cytochrome c reductase cytochrome b/c subunit [Scopulibacillus darangshiensis]TCP31626.1 menaquinol-cytochrome c reductase cytochrome b/c subunit [Scopulibacillus darangshiensis]